MEIFKWIPFLSYFKKIEQTSTQQHVTLPELNSNTQEFYKQRDSALYSLYIETELKKNKSYKPKEANYSPEEIEIIRKKIFLIHADFENWCMTNYKTKTFYPRHVNYIEKYENKDYNTSSIKHDDVCIDYYTQACNDIMDNSKRVQYFKDNIKLATKVLEQMPKPQPLTGYQYLIQQAKAGLAIDEFVKKNNIPDKRRQENGNEVDDIEDCAPAILDNDALRDFDSKNRIAFLHNYYNISKFVAREDRKAHFEKIIKDNLFSNQEFKFNLRVQN